LHPEILPEEEPGETILSKEDGEIQKLLLSPASPTYPDIQLPQV
jgi:hypothetical protein